MTITAPESPPESLTIARYWQPSRVQRCITASAYFYIGLMEDGRTVIKYPKVRTDDTMKALWNEAARYERLKPHKNLVTYKGISKDGLLLEFCEQGELLNAIRNLLTEGQRRKIGKQIAICLAHLHEQNFIHCDINVHNIFITSAMDAKIGDMQGQLYRPDGSVELPTMSEENVKSRHPEAGEDEFSPRTDIFALGTLFYHMWHGHAPFPELDEFAQGEEIQARYRKREFPIDGSQASGVDRIIYKCWGSEYEGAHEIVLDLDTLDVEEHE